MKSNTHFAESLALDREFIAVFPHNISTKELLKLNLTFTSFYYKLVINEIEVATNKSTPIEQSTLQRHRPKGTVAETPVRWTHRSLG